MDTPSSNQLRIPGVPGDNLDPDSKPHAIPRGERHTVSGQLGLTVDDWRIVKRDGYDVPRLSDCDEFGVVGMPVLPQLLRYVVLPAGATVSTIEVEPGEPVIAPGPLNAYPVQPPVPIAPGEPGTQALRRSTNKGFVPLADVRRLYPETLVVAGESRPRHGVEVVPLRIRPIQYDPAARTYRYYPHLRYRVHYEVHEQAAVARDADPHAARRLQQFVEEKGALLASDIHMSRDVVSKSGVTSVACVIITDNHYWPETVKGADGKPRPPQPGERKGVIGAGGAGGDGSQGPVGHFERLAMWKSARGVRTRVVTIADIVGGKYFDCTEGGFARDLQEVIRNFIDQAHRQWGVDYVLLGGSRKIIPMRHFLGHITCSGKYPGWDFYTYDKSLEPELDQPPPRGRLFKTRATRLCHDIGLGAPTPDTLLVTDPGRVIKFKDESDKALGWYFTDERFEVISTTPIWRPNPKAAGDTPEGSQICNILVEGPSTIIKQNMHWMMPERLVATDLYYACLARATNATGHAFDGNNNQVFGQYRWNDYEDAEASTDFMDTLLPDVKVGRAPVAGGNEARSFVDKVLVYERLGDPDGEAVDPEYLTRKLVVADILFQPERLVQHLPCASDAVEPAAGQFIHLPDANYVNHVLVHLDPKARAAAEEAGKLLHVVARFNATWGGTDVALSKKPANDPLLPHVSGWQFVERSDDQNTPVDEPTDYIRLVGPAFTQKPKLVLWFHSPANSLDTATSAMQELVTGPLAAFQDFTHVERCYAESYAVGGEAIPLNMSNVRGALDRGPHFVGLKGHGGENGIAYIYWLEGDGASDKFRNRGRPFIAYADSCYTARPDRENCRSLGETLVTHPNGAVAYVGYTSLGFDEGRSEHERFWRAVRRDGSLGAAAQVTSATTLWQVYEQILYGDPEMPVWTRLPKTYQVIHPTTVDHCAGKLLVKVLSGNLGKPGQRVTVMGGWRGGDRDPAFLSSVVTNVAGAAAVDLTNWPADLHEMTLTVVPEHRGGAYEAYVPYSVSLPVY